jgi:hypothetical protein
MKCRWCSREIELEYDALYVSSDLGNAYWCDDGQVRYHEPSIADVCREIAMLCLGSE